MNFTVFFLTHKALRKQNKILRERNKRQRNLLRERVVEYQVGYRDGIEAMREEAKQLHIEIQHLNDLLVAK